MHEFISATWNTHGGARVSLLTIILVINLQSKNDPKKFWTRRRSKDQPGPLLRKLLTKARKNFTCMEDPRTHGKVNSDSGKWFNACFYRCKLLMAPPSLADHKNKQKYLNSTLKWCYVPINQSMRLQDQLHLYSRFKKKNKKASCFEKNKHGEIQKEILFSPVGLIPNDRSELFLARFQQRP